MARPAPAAARALKIIDLLVSQPSEQFTISDIARRTETSLGSTHAVLAVLEETGYLTRHPTRKTYGLGPAMITAGMVALEQHPAVRVAVERISDLANELGADVVVTAATPVEIVFVAVGETASRYGPGLREGDRVPLAPPLGLVFMAWAPPQEVDAWIGRASSPLDRERVELARAAIRERGYALGLSPPIDRISDGGTAPTGEPEGPEGSEVPDRYRMGMMSLHDDYDLPTVDAEATYDLAMASAPVFDADGRVVAAITASGFSPGLAGRDVIDIGERVKACAVVVTKQTRGRLPA